MKKNNKIIVFLLLLIIVLLYLFFKEIKSSFDNNLKDKSVNFLFLVRDGQGYLKNNLNKIIEIGLSFKSYKIFFIENDSKDSTIDILKEMMIKNKNIKGEFKKINDKTSMEMCNNDEDPNCNKRTRFLASLRQEVLNNSMSTPSDLTIMLDLDFDSFDTLELFNMINKLYELNADGIFGMSYNTITKMQYDVGAIVCDSCFDQIKTKKDIIVKVESAFSGFGVYKTSSIKKYNASYDLNTDTIEHISFNKHLKDLYVYTLFNPLYTFGKPVN